MLTAIIKVCCNPVSISGEETSLDIYPGDYVSVSCPLSVPYIKVHEWVSDITAWIVRRPQVEGNNICTVV